MAKVMTARMPQAQIMDRSQSERLFYVVAASTMLVLTAVGFREFLLHGKGFGGGEITSQIVPLIIAHGLAMFSWVVFFFIQSILVLIGNRRLHMVIGPVGGVIAAGIVILGSIAALPISSLQSGTLQTLRRGEVFPGGNAHRDGSIRHTCCY